MGGGTHSPTRRQQPCKALGLNLQHAAPGFMRDDGRPSFQAPPARRARSRTPSRCKPAKPTHHGASPAAPDHASRCCNQARTMTRTAAGPQERRQRKAKHWEKCMGCCALGKSTGPRMQFYGRPASGDHTAVYHSMRANPGCATACPQGQPGLLRCAALCCAAL